MSRRQRRQRKQEPISPSSPSLQPLIGRTELIAAAFLFLGAAAIIGVVLLASGGGGDNGGDAVQATQTTDPSLASPAASIAPADQQAIAELARQSIESLPAGTWPDLYDDFTAAFQQRCPIDQFTQAGEDGADALGADLPLLGYLRLEEVTPGGGFIRAVVVGEIRGKSEYRTEEYFAMEGGAWKIAPAPGTEGCSAFNRITG